MRGGNRCKALSARVATTEGGRPFRLSPPCTAGEVGVDDQADGGTGPYYAQKYPDGAGGFPGQAGQG